MPATREEVTQFFDSIFRGSGFAVINRGGPQDVFFAWPEEKDKLLAQVKEWSAIEGANVYYVPTLFKARGRRIKENVADKVTTLYADLDTCHPSTCLVRPTIAIESSPGRYQALWLLDNPIGKFEAEELNKRIAYRHADQGADKSGWDLTQLLRVPGTVNWKQKYNRPTVSLLWSEPSLYRPAEFAEYPEVSVPATERAGFSGEFVSEPLPEDAYFQGMLDQAYQEAALKGERSKRVWWVMCRAAELGCSINQVYTAVLNYSPAQDKWTPAQIQDDVHRFVGKPNGWAKCHKKFLNDQEKPKVSTPVANGKHRITMTKATEFTPKRVRWGWDQRMPVGELTLIPGREGIGKSLFLAWLASNITNGTLPGEFYGQKRAVLYAASEDSWAYTIVPRMMAAGADLDLLYRVSVEEQGRLVLPLHTSMLPAACEEVKAAALMLDPIVSLVDEHLNVNQGRDLRQALEPLRQAAEEANIFIPALIHFNKATETDLLSKIPGARAWVEVARAAFALAQDREEEHFVASQIKNNLGRLDMPNLTYEIDSTEVITEDGPASVGLFKWTGESDTSAEELLSRKHRSSEDSKNLGASVKSKRVTDVVLKNNKVMSIDEIHEEVPDIPKTTIRQALKRAADKGTLSKPSTGQYGPPEA